VMLSVALKGGQNCSHDEIKLLLIPIGPVFLLPFSLAICVSSSPDQVHEYGQSPENK
jgi:hypothetical protein